MSEFRCDNCPLKNIKHLDHVGCASYTKPHPRFCQLTHNADYRNLIITESIREYERHNKDTLRDWGGNVASFTEAMIKWAKNGLIVAPTHVIEARRASCLQCPHVIDDSLTGHKRCNICKCFINAKTTIPTERCPLEPPRWDVYNASLEPPRSGCGCS